MKLQSMVVLLLFLGSFFPMAAALQITDFNINDVSNYTYTNTVKPTMTVVVTDHIPDATNIMFSCNTDNFSPSIPYNGTAYSDFNITDPSFGCNLEDGNRTITVRVTDTGGSTDASFNELALDRGAPTTNFEINPPSPDGNSGWYVSVPTITLSCTDAIGPCQPKYHWNSEQNQEYSTPLAAIEGNNSFIYFSTDAATNQETEQTTPIKVDTNSPSISSIVLNSGQFYTNKPNWLLIRINGSTDINACRFAMTQAEINDKSFAPYSVGQDYNWTGFTTSGDGNYSVFMQCQDPAGHFSDVNSAMVGVDTIPPSGISGTLGVYNMQTTQISLHWGEITDSGSGLKEYEIKKDGAVVATITDLALRDYNVTGLNPGTAYTFRLTARDNALNESFDEEGGVTVQNSDGGNPPGGPGGPGGGSGDTVSPTISWLKPDANAVLSGKVKLRVQVNDNNGVKSVSFYVDGTNPSNLLTRIYYSGSNQIEFEWDTARVSNGNHDIFARADDWGNNQAQISRKIKVRNAAGSRGNDQNASQEEQSAKAALANAKTEQQKAKAAIDLAKQFKLDFSAAQGKYSEGNSKLNAGQKACGQKNFSDCEAKSNEAIALFQEAASKTGLVLESSKLMGEPGALDFKGIFSASKLNPALAAFAEEIQSQMATERHLVVFKRTLENGEKVFFVRVDLKIKNNSGADNDFILVELVPKALTQSSDELIGTPDFVILEKDPLLEWKLDGFKNGDEITVSYTIDKTFSEQEIQALLNSSELNSYQLAPMIVKASAVQNTPLLLVPTSLLGLEFLANPTALAIIIGIIVILAFVFLIWQKNKAPRWPGRSAW